MKRVVILGIDNFSRKNIPQLIYMYKLGYVFDVFTNDTLGDSQKNIPEPHILYILSKGFISRLIQICKYLFSQKKILHHAEIYPGGRFAAFYVLACKMMRIKTLIVERGDLWFLDGYGPLVRLSAWFSYKTASCVWYREFYMEERLKKLNVKRCVFLGNACSMPNTLNEGLRTKKIVFLWLNRLVSARKAEWFVEILTENRYANTHNVIAGFQDNSKDSEVLKIQQYVKDKRPNNLDIYGYVQPEKLYLKAKFFVLPSDIVYCNNSLLEAMSYGVVPLVSKVEGAELIVDHLVNGYVFDHNKEGLRKAMEWALNLKQEQYEVLSQNAVLKIRREFSYDEWSKRLLDIYQSLEK